MITSTIAAAVLASTLTSPLPAAEASSSIIQRVPIVRENIGFAFNLNFETKCPDSHIYVHEDVLSGELPEHVGLTYFPETTLPPSFGKATKLRGAFYNSLNINNPYLSFDLLCTSNRDYALNLD